MSAAWARELLAGRVPEFTRKGIIDNERVDVPSFGHHDTRRYAVSDVQPDPTTAPDQATSSNADPSLVVSPIAEAPAAGDDLFDGISPPAPEAAADTSTTENTTVDSSSLSDEGTAPAAGPLSDAAAGAGDGAGGPTGPDQPVTLDANATHPGDATVDDVRPAYAAPLDVGAEGGDDLETASLNSASDVVEADHRIVGFNPADGRPTVINDSYREPSPDQGAREAAAVANAVRADEDATDAERASGERTLTGTPQTDVIDGRFVGMADGTEYRQRVGIRAVRIDRPFTADGRDGNPGDYLAENDKGERFVISQAELDEHFIAVT